MKPGGSWNISAASHQQDGGENLQAEFVTCANQPPIIGKPWLYMMAQAKPSHHAASARTGERQTGQKDRDDGKSANLPGGKHMVEAAVVWAAKEEIGRQDSARITRMELPAAVPASRANHCEYISKAIPDKCLPLRERPLSRLIADLENASVGLYNAQLLLREASDRSFGSSPESGTFVIDRGAVFLRTEVTRP